MTLSKVDKVGLVGVAVGTGTGLACAFMGPSGFFLGFLAMILTVPISHSEEKNEKTLTYGLGLIAAFIGIESGLRACGSKPIWAPKDAVKTEVSFQNKTLGTFNQSAGKTILYQDAMKKNAMAIVQKQNAFHKK